jgi:hypothetical protein
MQCLGNEELVRFRTVSIGGVDEIDAQLDCAPQNFLRVLAIRRPTPDPLACQAHRPKTEPVDQQIPAPIGTWNPAPVGPPRQFSVIHRLERQQHPQKSPPKTFSVLRPHAYKIPLVLYNS